MGWKDRIRDGLIITLAKALITLLLGSCRLRVHNAPPADGRPRIVIFWHRYLLYLMYHYRKTGARPLVSLSRDGERISSIATRFGLDPIRGSSSKGGARALLELIDVARKGDRDILITADGPKGPARELKPGLIKLSQKSGVPLVPACWSAQRAWVFEKSWDRFVLPKPFTRIDFYYGDEIATDDLSEEQVNRIMRAHDETIWKKIRNPSA